MVVSQLSFIQACYGLNIRRDKINLPAIVIARGGSKRIPRKNVKIFCGKPLLEWTLIQAKQSKFVTDVFLSTDDDEIAAIGERNKVNVIRRPTMPDDTPADIVYTLWIKTMIGIGYDFDEFVTLLPTSPNRKPDDIDNAISLYMAYGKPRNVRLESVIETWAGVFAPLGYGEMKPCYYMPSPTVMIYTGMLNVEPRSHWLVPKTIKDYRYMTPRELQKDFIGLRRKEMKKSYPVPYRTEYWQLFDIDTQEDFELCEILFKKYILDKGYYQ